MNEQTKKKRAPPTETQTRKPWKNKIKTTVPTTRCDFQVISAYFSTETAAVSAQYQK